MLDQHESDEMIFDHYLVNDEIAKAYEWALDSFTKKPWCVELKAFVAFAHWIKGKRKLALAMAEEVLGVNAYNEWALAVKFAYSNPEEIEEIPAFFNFDGFRLGSIWYLRFYGLGFPDAARRHWGFLVRYGPEEDKQALLEDVFGVKS